MWDASNGEFLRTFIGHSGGVLPVSLLRNSKCLASPLNERTIKFWDVEDGTCLQMFQIGREIWDVSFSACGLHPHTHIRTFAISTSSPSGPAAHTSQPQTARQDGAGLSSDEVWITQFGACRKDTPRISADILSRVCRRHRHRPWIWAGVDVQH